MLNFLYNFLYSTLSVVIGFFFILLGILAILLPWSPDIRTEIIQFFLENSVAISLFGFVFIIVGVILVLEVYLNMRRKNYYVRQGKKTIIIDEDVMKNYLQSYWKQTYPKQEVSSRLLIKKNRIKIVAELPFVPKLEQQSLVEHIQEDLQDIFSRILGYSHDLVLVASFRGCQKIENMQD